MKLKNKLILIFILFASFIIFNNNNCFAWYDRSQGYGTFSSAFSGEPTIENYISYVTSNLPFYRDYSYGFSYHIEGYDGDMLVITKNPIFISGNGYSINHLELYSDTPYYLYVSNLGVGKCASYNSFRVYQDYSGQKILIRYADFTSGISNIQANHDIYYIETGESFTFLSSPSTFSEFFTLNLRDRDLEIQNLPVHSFKLGSDENSSSYQELSDLIANDNKYCVYITDYTRYLVSPDPTHYTTINNASFVLSGYIDFLVSDHAYFYYSKHYNRIKECAGDYHYSLITDDVKRFFFNLVYSEDSDETYFEISDSNGLLWCLSDYVDSYDTQSELLSDFKNVYFVGSNQKIYYGIEDNNYILDGLSDYIYYGKNNIQDERTFNFDYHGGSLIQYYLSDDDFEDNVSSLNESNQRKTPKVTYEEEPNSSNSSESSVTFVPVIIPDSTEGSSLIIPTDDSTYTYEDETVTDETSQGSDSNHTQDERSPYYSSKDYDDTTGWSVWDFLKGIFGKIGSLLSAIGNLVSDLISGLFSLFVPSGNFFSNTFSDLGDWFEIKLGFIFYPFQFFLDLFDRLTNIEFGDPILYIPNITEPFSHEVLIHSTEFNFNDLLENENINTAHNYYLMFVDAILILGFINLLKNKFEEVTRK